MDRIDPARLEEWRDRLATVRARLRADFERSNRDPMRGLVRARATADLMYELVADLFDASNASDFAVLAMGGFGRREMAPFSDLDILFLIPGKTAPPPAVEAMLYALWDMKIKTGHAVRTMDECIAAALDDVSVATSMLEARLVAGSAALFDDFMDRFASEIVDVFRDRLVKDKLAERNARHRRQGENRYVLEPDVKDGVGALRDLQTLGWVGLLLAGASDPDGLVAADLIEPDEARTFVGAHAFFWRVRCALHDMAGRAEERLGFDFQPRMAELSGYTDHPGASAIERFMRHYFLHAGAVGALTRTVCAAVEAGYEDAAAVPVGGTPFLRRRKRLDLADPAHLDTHPRDGLRLIAVAQRLGLDVHPNAIRALSALARRRDISVAADSEAGRWLFEILTGEGDTESSLERLIETRLLMRLIPAFGHITARMQFDMYHHYTVDAHSVRAMAELRRIEGQTPVPERRALYLACLLHDIGKGRGGDHAEIGACEAAGIAASFGLSPDEVDIVSWLVREHKTLSHTAFKHDIDDPETLDRLVNIVQSPERLRLLRLLTEADIRAVGPGCWTEWKAALIGDLCARAEDVMGGEADAPSHIKRTVARAAELRAVLSDWPDANWREYAARCDDAYWLAFDVQHLVCHARWIEAGELPVVALADGPGGLTEVTVIAADRTGLFADVCGGLAAAGVSIHQARVHTLTGGLAVDSLMVEAPGGLEERRAERIRDFVLRMIGGQMCPSSSLAGKRGPHPPRADVIPVTVHVNIDTESSRLFTQVEVTGRDRPGLLYDLAHALSENGVSIHGARISTYGTRVVDIFSVKNRHGLKIVHPDALARIERSLMFVLKA